MNPRTQNPVSFIFRINELRESGAFAASHDINGQWVPTDAPGANVVVSAGATNVFWLCDGTSIGVLANDSKLLRKVIPYKTFSVFYSDGKGFHLLRDNALTSKREEDYFPLTFEHDPKTYSSFLTNAKFEPSLYCYRSDQKWMKMLLPDNYHGRSEASAPYGGLKGELAIFLALIAFAIPVDSLQQYLPSMFHSGKWQQYDMAHGRIDKRGVIVEVWTFPSRYGGSSEAQLEHFEENGMYYV